MRSAVEGFGQSSFDVRQGQVQTEEQLSQRNTGDPRAESMHPELSTLQPRPSPLQQHLSQEELMCLSQAQGTLGESAGVGAGIPGRPVWPLEKSPRSLYLRPVDQSI